MASPEGLKVTSIIGWLTSKGIIDGINGVKEIEELAVQLIPLNGSRRVAFCNQSERGGLCRDVDFPDDWDEWREGRCPHCNIVCSGTISADTLLNLNEEWVSRIRELRNHRSGQRFPLPGGYQDPNL